MKEESTITRRRWMKTFGLLALGSGFSFTKFALCDSEKTITALASTPAKEKILIVLYSLTGNTMTIAKQIQSITGGKIFEVVPITPYPEDHQATTEQAKTEISEGFKPELKAKLDNIKDYDTILVGSPCWWATMAPPLATFLSQHDFTGKTLIPFMTHEGSGLGRYVEDLRKLCPTATILDGKAFRGGSVNSAQTEVSTWLQTINVIK